MALTEKVKAAGHLSDELVWMGIDNRWGGGLGKGTNIATMDRKMWRTMIAYVLTGHIL